MMNRNYIFGICLSLLSVAFIGCSSDKSESGNEPDLAAAELSPVVARVNGETITEQDIEDTFSRTFSSAEALYLDENIKSKVLDSVIASRAIAQAAKKTISEDDLRALEASVRAYKEELFIKAYLEQNITPEPVSSKMVQDYYNTHLTDFGAATVKKIEFIRVVDEKDEAQRALLFESYSALKDMRDWAAWAKSKPTFMYRQAWATPGLLNAALESYVVKLADQEVSSVVLIEGVAHIIRVVEQREEPAKPLSEVSASIRKRLVPLQLRKAVKEVSEKLVSESVVEFVD